MNWSDAVGASSSSFHVPSRHVRPELLRSAAFEEDEDAHERQLEAKFDDDMPSLGRYPDTHLGRLASVFSDRMPCTGMYGLAPSITTDGTFTIQDLDSGGAGSDAMPHSALSSLDGSGSSGGGYALPSSLEMQQFDENAVDLQQLFPSTGSSLHLHSIAPPTAGPPGCFVSHVSQQSDPGLTGAVDQFSDSYHSLPPPSDQASGMLLPFHFGASQSTFDDPDDMSVRDSSGASMDMQDVSNLFNHNASLMTPPTAITIPRMTIVSPINGFGPPRNLLPPSVRESKAEILSLAMDDPNLKFSNERRKLCCVDGCKSQARAFNRCKRHGGSKRCSHPGCTKSVQSRGLCIRHGGGSRCQENGCTRAAQSHGKCKMHGGGRPCVVPGCEKKAHLKRLCRKHGGGAKCSLPECEKWAQRQGMCMTHSKHQHSLLASPPPSDGAFAPSSPSSSYSASPVSSTASIAGTTPVPRRPMRAFFHEGTSI